ncbi:fumarylacetoacetate hydrolase family protein [Oceanobacillus manasiensis]|uniref:fumarylacetoacetate hydrolase family protein n=1 Tax=Oceanobacillus manasiensis TaxID=586413 RepID=UPI0005AADD88|nr:fumarylacetoacetate hydrolase family protein [Oceanobacillus manasiensis]
MKLVSYRKEKNSPFQMGVLLDTDKVLDLQDANKQLELSGEARYEFPADPTAFFTGGFEAVEKARQVVAYVESNQVESMQFDRDEVELGTPISKPGKIICVGKNYAEHAAEMKSDISEHPVLFAKFANSLIGPEDVIVKSPLTNKLDYEAELTIVIGKEASHVQQEHAVEYILGYTIGNDISARDLQKRTPQWLQGKTLDRSTPVGPWVVTADEIADPANLEIKSFVNGEKRQSSNTKHLIFNIPYLIEFISSIMKLEAGDIILTGTPSGVGLAMDPPGFLNDGDLVTVEIENIGKMENKVEAYG